MRVTYCFIIGIPNQLFKFKCGPDNFLFNPNHFVYPLFISLLEDWYVFFKPTANIDWHGYGLLKKINSIHFGAAWWDDISTKNRNLLDPSPRLIDDILSDRIYSNLYTRHRNNKQARNPYCSLSMNSLPCALYPVLFSLLTVVLLRDL